MGVPEEKIENIIDGITSSVERLQDYDHLLTKNQQSKLSSLARQLLVIANDFDNEGE